MYETPTCAQSKRITANAPTVTGRARWLLLARHPKSEGHGVPRTIWKGAITFGLVYIPVNVYPGSSPETLDLDLLDKRDFAAIGYRRVTRDRQ